MLECSDFLEFLAESSVFSQQVFILLLDVLEVIDSWPSAGENAHTRDLNWIIESLEHVTYLC
jgi:hypothetical protein